MFCLILSASCPASYVLHRPGKGNSRSSILHPVLYILSPVLYSLHYSLCTLYQEIFHPASFITNFMSYNLLHVLFYLHLLPYICMQSVYIGCRQFLKLIIGCRCLSLTIAIMTHATTQGCKCSPKKNQSLMRE